MNVCMDSNHPNVSESEKQFSGSLDLELSTGHIPSSLDVDSIANAKNKGTFLFGQSQSLQQRCSPSMNPINPGEFLIQDRSD